MRRCDLEIELQYAAALMVGDVARALALRLAQHIRRRIADACSDREALDRWHTDGGR